MKDYQFETARPVWAKQELKTMNASLVFRALLPDCASARLHIAGHSDYQIFLNGAFVAQGPARAGHGFFRVDELDLSGFLTAGRNVLCILCAGYNVNSFYLTDQPPFVCAEVFADGRLIAATGTPQPFVCAAFDARVKKVQRFSFQRPFTESYRFDADYDRIFLDPDFAPLLLETVLVEPKHFLKRETLRSDYERRDVQSVTGTGTVAPSRTREREFHDRSLTEIGETIKGYRREELEISAVEELYGFKQQILDASPRSASILKLGSDAFAVYDMGVNTTGYIRLELDVSADTVVYAVFNEMLPPDGIPDPGRDNTACVVRWALQGGRAYTLLSFEPYTYRYIQVLSVGGAVTVTQVSQLCEHYPAVGLLPRPDLRDKALQTVFDAAVETFRQNATDIFMDCPSRERAGWLCDSFFTARAERALTGESRIETAFLENFLMEPSFAHLPGGMLPMCYPSDHYDGCYIPNWAMWFLLELAEYRTRSGDQALIEKAKDKMYALAAFLRQYENADGLLEKLDSWVFVEWSRANDFVQDVNFPTNMLYAKFLETIGALYQDPALIAAGEKKKETIRKLSFDGAFFRDHAVRENGTLLVLDDHTETAQYYAFFTGVASPQSCPALYELMRSRFGPGRDPETQFPDVPVSNAFIGNFLRLDILFQNGEYDQLLEEVRAFFLPMAKTTGTLWEHMNTGASCCHGFASHVAYWLLEIARRQADLC